MTAPIGFFVNGQGVKVVVRNFAFYLQVRFPITNAQETPCPACKLWKNRNTKMTQIKDAQGNRWWFCKSYFFTRKWNQCGSAFPVGVPLDDEGLLEMMKNRIKYLDEVKKQDVEVAA